jgi:hypothetical protein
MIRRILTLLAIALSLLPICAIADGADSEMVLVTSQHSPANALAQLDVRKLFMGIPVIKDKQRITPLINTSSKHIQEIFLQYTVFMSEKSYRRQLLKRSIKHGAVMPKKFDDLTRLVQQLNANPSMVSFLWSTDLEQYPDLKIINVY